MHFYLGPECKYTLGKYVDQSVSCIVHRGWNKLAAKWSGVYLYPLLKAFKRAGLSNAPFALASGDLTGEYPGHIVKNRAEGARTGTIVRCMEENRHWGGVWSRKEWANKEDIPFSAKKSIAIWRGTNTGNRQMSGNRFTLVESWFNRDHMIDVGFSSTCQKKMNAISLSREVWNERIC